MSKFVYVYDDLRNPENNYSSGAAWQLVKDTGINERRIGRLLSASGVYMEPTGKFKLMRLIFKPDKRSKNGNTNNFKEAE